MKICISSFWLTCAASITALTKNEAWQGKRFAVVSQLLSVKNNQRIRVRVWVSDDDFPVVESIVDIYNSADWYEREAFDMYGIMFQQPSRPAPHPDRLRLCRTSVPQRLPDFRLCRNALRRRAKTRDLSTCYH